MVWGPLGARQQVPGDSCVFGHFSAVKIETLGFRIHESWANPVTANPGSGSKVRDDIHDEPFMSSNIEITFTHLTGEQGQVRVSANIQVCNDQHKINSSILKPDSINIWTIFISDDSALDNSRIKQLRILCRKDFKRVFHFWTFPLNIQFVSSVSCCSFACQFLVFNLKRGLVWEMLLVFASSVITSLFPFFLAELTGLVLVSPVNGNLIFGLFFTQA